MIEDVRDVTDRRLTEAIGHLETEVQACDLDLGQQTAAVQNRIARDQTEIAEVVLATQQIEIEVGLEDRVIATSILGDPILVGIDQTPPGRLSDVAAQQAERCRMQPIAGDHQADPVSAPLGQPTIDETGDGLMVRDPQPLAGWALNWQRVKPADDQTLEPAPEVGGGEERV
jgi:hypothetical protein